MLSVHNYYYLLALLIIHSFRTSICVCKYLYMLSAAFNDRRGARLMTLTFPLTSAGPGPTSAALKFYIFSGIPKIARSWLTQCSKSCDLQPNPHCNVQCRGILPCEGGGCDRATSQLDLPQLGGWPQLGWLQLEAPHWATSVNYYKQLIIELTFCGSRFSSGRLLAIEDFTLTFTLCMWWIFELPEMAKN